MPKTTKYRDHRGYLLPKEKQLHLFERKYTKEHGKQLRSGMRSQGMSIPEVCRQWDILTRTYWVWVEKYPDFKYSHEMGQRDCACFWFETLRDAALGNIKGSDRLIAQALKNIDEIRWSDTVAPEKSKDEEVRTITINVLPQREEPKQLNSMNVVGISAKTLDAVPVRQEEEE